MLAVIFFFLTRAYSQPKGIESIIPFKRRNLLHLNAVADPFKMTSITGIDAVVLMLILGLLIYIFLLRQRNKRKDDANQKELDDKYTFLMATDAEKDKLLQQNRWLIKELHHRVKNNLQIIISLLQSQSAYVRDKAALSVVKDSLRRTQAIALSHQWLYQDENATTIPMQRYIDDLLRYLNESFDGNGQIAIEQMVDPVNLDINQATPLGLIITESVVNAIKHAFPNDRNGIIKIHLIMEAYDQLLLEISDNGIGLPGHFDSATYESLGFNLMLGLSKQLGGSFSVENDNGMHIKVKFIVCKGSEIGLMQKEGV